MSAGVTVGSLVGLREEAPRLNFEVLAGGAGLDRRIATSFLQTIGLALAGIDEGLRSGHALQIERHVAVLRPRPLATHHRAGLGGRQGDHRRRSERAHHNPDLRSHRTSPW